MAHIEVTGFDEVLKKLEKMSDLGKMNEVARKAVQEAQPINESSVRSALAAVEHGPYATGSVSGSISSTTAKINAYGAFAVARPTGRDAKGVRNGEKAAYLQYGSPKEGPRKLEARPWRQIAVASAESACIKSIEATLKSELELD